MRCPAEREMTAHLKEEVKQLASTTNSTSSILSTLLFLLILPLVADVILEAYSDLSIVQFFWAAVTDNRHSSYAVDTPQVNSPPGVVLQWDWGTGFLWVLINGHICSSCTRSWFCGLHSYSSRCHVSWCCEGKMNKKKLITDAFGKPQQWSY